MERIGFKISCPDSSVGYLFSFAKHPSFPESRLSPACGDNCESLPPGSSVMMAQGLAHRDDTPFALYLLRTSQGLRCEASGGTFKVHQAVSIEVNVLQDLVHLPLAETLPQQDLEGRPELPHADAAVPVGVELWRESPTESSLLSPRPTADTQPSPPSPGRTSRKASRSSRTPIMSAVSASSLGPISSTKSSKSTFPPPGGHARLLETQPLPLTLFPASELGPSLPLFPGNHPPARAWI